MSLPRRPDLDALEAQLLQCEGQVRLLDRATPSSFSGAVEGMVAGSIPLDAFRMPVSPLTSSALADETVRRVLDALARVPPDLRAELLVERASELLFEIELARSLGTPDVVDLIQGALSSFTDQLAEADASSEEWLAGPDAEEEDEEAPSVLLEEMARIEVEERGLFVRVVARDMPSRAAAGPGTLFVQRRLVVSRKVARRILVHELDGHLLPRLSGVALGAPFSIGPSGASFDEEGYALELERRSGFLEGSRRRELALRHRASRRSLSGDSPDLIVQELCDLGLARDVAIRIWARAARGPGLGRDLSYLAGFIQVSRAFARDPGLERWFRMGRMSAGAALRLERTFRPE